MPFVKEKIYNQSSLFGRTYRACLTPKTTLLGVSWDNWLGQTLPSHPEQTDGRVLVSLPAPKGKSRGASLMLNISESHNDAVVSSLSQVLERENFDTTKVLFEQARLRGDSAKGGSAKEDVASAPSWGVASADQKVYDMTHPCDVVRVSETVPTLKARMGTGGNGVPCVVSKTLREVVPPVLASCGDKQFLGNQEAFGGQYFAFEETPFRISSFDSFAMKSDNPVAGIRTATVSPTLDTTLPTPAKGQGGLAIVSAPSYAIAENVIGRREDTGGNGPGFSAEVCYTPNATGVPGVAEGLAVRRLTARECERLQGFPDDWTKIEWKGKSKEQCPDAPRYKAIGNSWAVPVVRWLGERMDEEFSTGVTQW